MENTANKSIKVYVAIKADFTEDGTMLPKIITWEDGEEFEIDRITNIRQSAAMKAGGQGDRYTVMIRGSKAICFSRGVQILPGIILVGGLLREGTFK